MSTSKSGGCGCAGCACGTGTCTDESFRRPSFFAGQLLTEDDLQAMMDYVVGKNRLHNRYLFGEGVVCGLGVTCHPCGGGTVMVAPGYGLDCCGNDLLLPCPEEVDIRALLRDLRKRQLAGYDCGDPCDDPAEKRTYGLYLAYRETPEDLVAPYNSGDPCGQQACEPSRICEGYKFELRCECTLEESLTLYRRVWACIGGDLEAATTAVQRASRLFVHGIRVRKSIAGPGAAGPDLTGLTASAIEERRVDAAWLKAWLLTRLEQSATRTRCDLYDRVLVTRVRDLPSQDGRPDAAALEAEADDQLALVQVLLEYLIDCACQALNPPCSPCDDTALLLACIELDGCDVVEICNLSRRFVLSPAAMRYWLPVDLLGKAFQYACCEFDVAKLFDVEPQKGQDPRPAVPPPARPTAPTTGAPRSAARTRGEASLTAAAPDNLRVALERVGLRAQDIEAAAAFSTSLAELALRVGDIDSAGLRRRASTLTDDFAARVRPDAGSIVEVPAVKERMTSMVREELVGVRDSVAEELRGQVGTETSAAIATLGASVAADVSSRMTVEVDRVVRKELAATKLNAAVDNLAVVKTLRKENDKLRAEVGKLAEAVRKLGAKP